MYVLLDDDQGRLTFRRLRPWHRMLAGLEDSEFGQAHAEELLAMAAHEREADWPWT